MKKIMKPFVLVAAAAMALASCQKNEIPAPEKQNVHFTINAGIGSKTHIDETLEDGKTVYKAQWDGNEELGVLFDAPNAKTVANDVVVLNNAEAGELASFQGDVTVDATTGTFYSFYPASAFNRGYEQGDARLDLKNAQKPTATSFDPTCDILVAKPYDYTVEEGVVVADGLEFARIMSVLRIDLKSTFADIQNEFVESVSFTAGDVQITGYARIFLDNPKFDKWASNEAHWRTVTANYDSDLVSINGTSNSVYLVIAPVTIPANKDLTFEIKTKNYNISKTIKSPEMKFTAGKVSKINLSIAAENCEKIDQSIDYSGEWLITGVKDSRTYAVSAYVDGNNLDVLVPITVADDKITEVDGLAACKMTITKVSTEGYAGLYTIEDSNSSEQKRSYLYAAGTGTNNYLKASSTLSAGSYWDITKNDNGTYTIIASKHTSERNTIWYNSSNNIFSCYQSNSTSYKPITLYPYSMVVPDTTPKLELGEESIELTAAGGEDTIDVTAKNLPAEIQVRVLTAEGAQGTVEWLTAEYADEAITYTAAANESTEARTAYIEVYVSDELKTGVSVTQAGKQAEGGESTIETWSWAGGGKTEFGNDSNVYKTYGLGSDYANSNAPYLIKLDGTGDYFIVQVDGAIQSVSIDVKMLGGATTSYLDVQGSADGTTFTSVQKLTISGSQNTVLKLATTKSFDSSYRYIKFYFTKGSNVGVGPMSITYMSGNNAGGGTTEPDPEQPGEGGGETPDSGPKSYTLTIDAASFNTTSYAANNNEKTSTAIATDGTTMDVKWTSYQVMKQSSAMQWQKNAGYIYNSTDLGTITDVTITSTGGTFTKYVNSSQKPTTNGSGGYFQVKVGSATGTTSKIVITFTK